MPPAFIERVLRLLSPDEPVAVVAPRPIAGARHSIGGIHGSARWSRGALLAVAALALIAAGYFALARFMLPERSTPPTPPSAAVVAVAPEKSIAVLPFVDMSEKHDQEYFSDGLSEELIDQLTRIADLRVIARTSSFAFKGKNQDMRTIAAQLGVANLLEGSVRKAGSELRITAQLIRAADGVHLWSQTYDRKLTDVFKVQEDIAATVASALKATLQQGAVTAIDKTTSIEAHNLYLQGRYFAVRATVEDMGTALGYYEQALRLDPDYAAAWAALGEAHAWNAQFGNASVAEATEQARAAARTALRLDPRLSEPHATLALIHSSYDFDWAGARVEVDRAIALDPRNPENLMRSGSIAFAFGEIDKAIQVYREATAIDPLRASGYLSLGGALHAAGREDEALEALRSCARITPGQVKIHYMLGQVALAQKRPTEARAFILAEMAPWYRLTGLAIIEDAQGNRAAADAALAQLTKDYGDTAAAQIAEVYAHRRDLDSAFNWLERGVAQRDPGLRWLKVDPFYASIRGDPRYKELLKKIGLPEG